MQLLWSFLLEQWLKERNLIHSFVIFNRGKALAGVCRAAFRTDAYIIDSGIGSGIEKFCLRKNVNLIGLAPENEISYPRINP